MGKQRRYASLMGIAVVVSAAVFVPGPQGQALAPGALGVYVSNNDGDTVSVINPDTDTVVATVDVGSEPRNLAGSPDRSTVYVPNRHSDNVSVIDTDTNTVATTIEDDSFDEPYALAFTPDGSSVYVANKEGGGSTTGSVTVIDTATQSVTGTIDDACFVSPEGIAVNPVLNEAYVVNRQGNSVCVIDTTTDAVVDTIAVGNDPRFAVVTPDGSSLFVSNDGSGDVTRITTATGATTTIDTPGSPRNMALSSDGSKVYVGTLNDDLAIIAVSDNSVTGITFTDACEIYAVTIVPGTDLGYATDACNDEVFTFDAATDAETGVINDDGFDTPRAIASLGAQPPPPPSSTTTTTTPGTPTTGAQAGTVTPRFTG
jgi:YVTN family beta-propeller protein